jgi:hypothetical protein
MSERGILITLAILTVMLPLGGLWWQSRQLKIGAEPEITEQWLRAAARFFYGVGLPYLGLITGLLPPRYLGLKGLENLALISWGSNLADLQKAASIIWLECLVDAAVFIRIGLLALLLLAGIKLGLAHLGFGPIGPAPALLDTIYESLHWAFYRAIFWLITADLYLGVTGGIAWVLLEGMLIAWAQRSWPVQKPYFLAKMLILVLTSVIFFYVPNLWLLGPIHYLFAAVLASQFRAKRVGANEEIRV